MKPSDLCLLYKLMMMTTSSYDHEALIALRKANALLARENLNWEEALTPCTPATSNIKSQPKSTADDTSMMFDVLLSKINPESSFYAFVVDVHGSWLSRGYLTPKQYDAIKNNYLRCK